MFNAIEKSFFLNSSSSYFDSSLTKPWSFPARVFIKQQEIMYVMQLHSAYGACVGVKGNYAQPVYFPQLDDGYFLFFSISLLF